MDKDILALKLNRVVWISLLEKEEYEKAINFFDTYISGLDKIKAVSEYKDLAEEEIKISTKEFLNRLSKISQKFYDNGQWSDAAICYAAYFKYKSDDFEMLKNFSDCLGSLNQHDLKNELLHILDTAKITEPEQYKILAQIFAKDNNPAKSTEYINKYFNAMGSDITAFEYNLRGCFYNSLFSEITQNIEDAYISLRDFEKASDLEPNQNLYAKNATIMAGKCEEAKIGRKYWDRVLKNGNLSNDDKYDYAAFCLKNEDFNGWHEYFDARFDKENNATPFPKINKQRWNGKKDLSKSTLLVRCEQGFGDTFLMYGYMQRLTKLAKKVIFVVQDAIYPLLKENNLGVEVFPESKNLDEIKFDCYIPSMSIPIALKMTRKDLSVGEGYIKADPKLVAEYKEKYFNNDKFKIGLSFSGSCSGNKTRDIKVENMLPLDELENVELYSLTKDLKEDAFSCFKNHKVKTEVSTFNDFSQTAAYIENLDIVLTADNCILNLSGALGKKTFALFNWSYEFRWFDLSGDNVVWLTSVKPFKNDVYNDWSSSINKAIKEIKKLIKN